VLEVNDGGQTIHGRRTAVPCLGNQWRLEKGLIRRGLSPSLRSIIFRKYQFIQFQFPCYLLPLETFLYFSPQLGAIPISLISYCDGSSIYRTTVLHTLSWYFFFKFLPSRPFFDTCTTHIFRYRYRIDSIGCMCSVSQSTDVSLFHFIWLLYLILQINGDLEVAIKNPQPIHILPYYT
jgi:hypothetical protein